MAYKDNFIVPNNTNDWQAVKESFFANTDLNWKKVLVRLVEKNGRWRFVESDKLQEESDSFQVSEINMLRFSPGSVVEILGKGFIPYAPAIGSFEFLNPGALIFAYYAPGDPRNGYTVYDGTQSGAEFKYSGSFFGFADRYTDSLISFRECEIWDIATDTIMNPSSTTIASQFGNYFGITGVRKSGNESLVHSTLCGDGCAGTGYFGGSANGGLSRSDIFGSENANKKFTLSVQFYLDSTIFDEKYLWNFISPDFDKITVFIDANRKLQAHYTSPRRNISAQFISQATLEADTWNHVLMGKRIAPADVNVPQNGPNSSVLSFYLNGNTTPEEFTIGGIDKIMMHGQSNAYPNDYRNYQTLGTKIEFQVRNDLTIPTTSSAYGFTAEASAKVYSKNINVLRRTIDGSSAGVYSWDVQNFFPQEIVATGPGVVYENTGKYLYRVSITTLTGTAMQGMCVGFTTGNITFPRLPNFQGPRNDGFGWNQELSTSAFHSGFSQGDTVEAMIDTDNNTLTFWVNESLLFSESLGIPYPLTPAVHIGKNFDTMETYIDKSQWAPFLSTINTAVIQAFPGASVLEPKPVIQPFDMYFSKYLINLGNGPDEVNIAKITDIQAPVVELVEVGNTANVLRIPPQNFIKKRDERIDFKVPEDFPQGYYHLKVKTASDESFTIPFRVQPDDVQTTPWIEDFSDIDRIRQNYAVLQRAWGGENRGVVKENVRYDAVNEELIIAAHGDQYTGPIRGCDRFGNVLTDEYIAENDIRDFVCAGAPIEQRPVMTNPYFRKAGVIAFNKRTGYGKYRVTAKFPNFTGCVYAFWTFFYNEVYEADDKWDFYTSSNRDARFNSLAAFNFHRPNVPDFFFSRGSEVKFEIMNTNEWVMRGGIGESSYLDFHYYESVGGEKYPSLTSNSQQVMQFGFLDFYPQKLDPWSISFGYRHESSQIFTGSQDGKRNSVIKYGEGSNWVGVDVEYNASGQATLEFVMVASAGQVTQTIATLDQGDWLWVVINSTGTNIVIAKWDVSQPVNLGSPGIDQSAVYSFSYPAGTFAVTIPPVQNGNTGYAVSENPNPNIPENFTYRESKWEVFNQTPILGTPYLDFRKQGIDKLTISDELLTETMVDHLFKYRGKFSTFNDNPNCGIQGSDGRYAVRNHEIDIEIPSHLKSTGMTDENIKLNNMKTMTWRSEIGRYSFHDKQYDSRGNWRDERGVIGPDPSVENIEKNYHSNYMPMFADGSNPAGDFHEWGFDWYPDRIEYFVDGVLRHTNYDSEMGRTIPSIAGRFTMGIWFPRYSVWNSGTQSCGTPNNWAGSQAPFSEIEMRIKQWSFEPFTDVPPAGNQGETYPYAGYAPFNE
jgi:hypothetical protein